jgi:hypothetical protein
VLTTNQLVVLLGCYPERELDEMQRQQKVNNKKEGGPVGQHAPGRLRLALMAFPSLHDLFDFDKVR